MFATKWRKKDDCHVSRDFRHPKVVQWAEENCQQHPFCIKRISKYSACTAQTGTIRLPASFVRENFGMLRKVLTLEDQDGKTWQSMMSGRMPYPNLNGWTPFARSQGLRRGEYIIFILVDDAHFLVRVFDKQGNARGIPGKRTKIKGTPVESSQNVQANTIFDAVLKGGSSAEGTTSDTTPRNRGKAMWKNKKPDKTARTKRLSVGLEYNDRGDCFLVLDSDTEGEGEAQRVESEEDRARAVTALRVPKTELFMPKLNSKTEKLLSFIRDYQTIQDEEELDEDSDGGQEDRSSPSRLTVLKKLQEDPGELERVREMARPDFGSSRKRRRESGMMEEDTPWKGKLEEPFLVTTADKRRASEELQESSHQRRKVKWVPTKSRRGNCELQEGTSEEDTPDEAFTVTKGEKINKELEFDPLAFVFNSTRRNVTIAERRRAVEAGEAYARMITGSSFMVIMAERNVHRDFSLDIPVKFVSEANLPAQDTVLTLIDCTGQSRRALCLYKQHTRKRTLCCGEWASFAIEHLLEEGDVCVFELTDTEAFTVLVRIFRVAGIPKVGRKHFRFHYKMVLNMQNLMHELLE